MSDDTHRALGAGGGTIKIGDREHEVRPYTVKELSEVERECVAIYKREYLRTFADNKDLLDPDEYKVLLRDEFRKAARWDVSDLPDKQAADVQKIHVTDLLLRWLRDAHGPLADPPEPDADDDRSPEELELAADHYRRLMLAAAIDERELTIDEYMTMASEHAPTPLSSMDYVKWWMSSTREGNLTFIWVGLRDEYTKKQLAEKIGRDPMLVAEIVRRLEGLSVPDVGNGPSPAN